MKIATALHYHLEWEDYLDFLNNTEFSRNYEWSETICDPFENSDPEIGETEQTLINRNIKTERQNITLSKKAKFKKSCFCKICKGPNFANPEGSQFCQSGGGGVLFLPMRRGPVFVNSEWYYFAKT